MLTLTGTRPATLRGVCGPNCLHDAHPELKFYAKVLAYPEHSGLPENALKGAALKGPAGWAERP